MAQYIPANDALEQPKFVLTFPAGINQNQTPNVGECASGYNFELGARQDKLTPRAAFDTIGSVPNGAAVTGIAQLLKRTGVQTSLVFAGTVAYKWNNDSSFSSVGAITNGAKIRDTYWSLGDYIILVDVNPTTANPVLTWDGTTLSTMTTGLAGAFSAKYCVIWNNRAWFFNITLAGVNYPHMIVVSAFENPQSLSSTARGGPTNLGGTTFATGLEAFYLFVPDLKKINGVSLFQNVLVISTMDGQLFKLTGSSASDYAFTDFYVGSAAVGYENMVNIGNDIAYIRKGQNINLVRSVQAFGDVKSNDIARWIPDLVAGDTNSLAVYDQANQKILWFWTNKVAVLFKDILYGAETDSAINLGLSPWSQYTTTHPSGFNTSAARYMEFPYGALQYNNILIWTNNNGNVINWANNAGTPIHWSYTSGAITTGDTAYSVIWGDASGYLYNLYGTGNYDGGTYPIQVSRTSRLIDLTIVNPFPWNEEILLGRVQYRRLVAQTSFGISFQWSDEYNTSTSSMQLKGSSASLTTSTSYNLSSYYGKAYYSYAQSFQDVISHQNFSPTGKGSGFYLTISNQGAGKWQVDHVELY